MATRKVYIFLDVDGVLNSLRSLVAMGDLKGESLDPLALRLLQVLCESYAAEGYSPRIVISSDWRLKYSASDMAARLNPVHSPHVVIEGCTPNSKTALSRGNEIEEYLISKDINFASTAWLALDDQPLGANDSMRVQIDPTVGLTHDNIDEAFRRITGKRLLPEGLEYMGKWQQIKAWDRVRSQYESAWAKQGTVA